MHEPTTPIANFRRVLTPEQINAMHENTIVSHLGIDFLEVGPDWLRARMPVDERTRQPVGILHGGASVALAETLGSVAAYMCVAEGMTAVGLDINANHVRAMRDGWVYGMCKPVHVGRSTHVWQIEIRDGERRMVCTSRLTMAVVPDRER